MGRYLDGEMSLEECGLSAGKEDMSDHRFDGGHATGIGGRF